MAWASRETPPLGTTVTLQVETPIGSIGVVGVLLETDSKTWSVRRRDGSVSRVDVAMIRACRVVPPGRATRATVEEVERIAALGWRGLRTARLGEWLLRAGGGFTGRANSVLALGDPGIGYDEALDRLEAWYAAQSLPVRFQLVDREAPAGLVDALNDRGWAISPLVHVMTAELGHVLRAVGESTAWKLRLDHEPDAAWLSCYRQDGEALPAAAREILTNHPQAIFASVRDGDRCVAIARGVVDNRWAGVHAVEVAATDRNHGLGALVTAAALRWCGQRGGRLAYLQVSADNTPAIRLYGRLNFTIHHNYVYREDPAN